jgi:hypothetical protein
MVLASTFASLLLAVALIAALLATTRLRLVGLPDITTARLFRRLVGPGHVVAVLNHVLTAQNVFAVSYLCHKNSS